MPKTLSPRDLKVVGRFELLERLSDGSMGSVYRARDRDSGSIVALKLFTSVVSANEKLAQRISREIQAASKLDHPNIVRVIEFGKDTGRSFYTMEFVEGCSLGQMIETDGPIEEESSVRILTQVAQALHYAHNRRVIHRDVKPDNVLVRPDGHVKLTDFGLAKDGDDDRELTRAATGLGTPHFMAPEQYEDARNATALSDVYSLGATLFTAVTGKLPFADCTSLIALARKAKGDIPSPKSLAPKLSEHVDAAIRAAMHPEPTKRPMNCLFFIQMLSQGRKARKRSGPISTQSTTRPATEGSERRAAERHSFRIGTLCVINTGATGGEASEEWPTRIVDVSETGLGVILARRFEKGAMFAIEVQGDARSPAVTLRVKVVRVHKEPLGHWFHGCQFLFSLSEDDLRSLVG